MAARFKDAQAGWETLRQSGFTLSRAELNARLEATGFRPISERTFAHYHKLRRYGYERYVPINQLDVKSLKDPLWDQAVRGRYPVQRDPVEVTILGIYRANEFEIPGTTFELSPSYLRARVDQLEAVELLSKGSFQRHLKASRVTARFPETGESFSAVVEKVMFHAEKRTAFMVARFVSLASVERVGGRTLLPTDKLSVRIVPTSDEPLLAEVTRKLYWLFQTLDTCKVITEEYLSELGFGDKYAVPSVRVTHLAMDPELHATIEAATPTLHLITTLAERLSRARAEHVERSDYAKARNPIFTEISTHIKRGLMHQMAEYEKQVQLPLGESFGRSNELAESQLLPSMDELLDEASGQVTFEVIGNTSRD